MFIKIQLPVEDDFSRTLCSGDSTLEGKHKLLILPDLRFCRRYRNGLTRSTVEGHIAEVVLFISPCLFFFVQPLPISIYREEKWTESQKSWDGNRLYLGHTHKTKRPKRLYTQWEITLRDRYHITHKFFIKNIVFTQKKFSKSSFRNVYIVEAY